MHSIRNDLEEFQGQLRKGAIQNAYRALLFYMLGLRTHFQNRYPDSAVSALYQGYLDMTYFAVVPPPLKQRDLKIAIVFNYDAFRFEAWLAGRNRAVNRRYWPLFRDGPPTAYRVVAPAKGVDAIVECDLTEEFDLTDPDALTSKIETATAAFIDYVERFLEAEPCGQDGSQGRGRGRPKQARRHGTNAKGTAP